jgi:hypothetical protein
MKNTDFDGLFVCASRRDGDAQELQNEQYQRGTSWD